jgi:hypothetical protein
MTWYGGQGVPDVRIDGKYRVLGAGSCASAYQDYSALFLQRRQETGGLSPIEISGSYAITGSRICVRATYRLVDPVTLSDLRATLLVYEDSVIAAGGFETQFYDDTWQRVTRTISDQDIALAAPGDTATLSLDLPVNPLWNAARLHVVAYVQQTTGDRPIVQGALLPPLFRLIPVNTVRSVPPGNGEAVFDAVLTNTGSRAATFTVEPGAPFGDWPSDFTIGGGGAHHEPVEVVLDSGQGTAVSLRVHTDGRKEIRTGGLRVTGPLFSLEGSVRVFNGSPAVMLVDKSGDQVNAPIGGLLDELGTLYQDWPSSILAPVDRDLRGFDVLIWDAYTLELPVPEDELLARFMDGGGALLLASQYYLDYHSHNQFEEDYLGIAARSLSLRYLSVSGVPGDPIGQGLVLPLQFQHSWSNDTDGVRPAPGAHAVLNVDAQWAGAVRLARPGGGRSVFLGFPFAAISPTDPDPNNQREVLSRILEWIRPSSLSDTDGAADRPPLTQLDPARPNPFGLRTDVSFFLSKEAAAGAVRLEVFDATGRKIAGLFSGTLLAGRHQLEWNGRSDAGADVANGLYFVRLTTVEGPLSRKLMLLRR